MTTRSAWSLIVSGWRRVIWLNRWPPGRLRITERRRPLKLELEG